MENKYTKERDRCYVHVKVKGTPQRVIIDWEDLPRVFGYRKWRALHNGSGYTIVAPRWDDARKVLVMSRLIMDAKPGQKVKLLNADPLDLRKKNLLLTDHAAVMLFRRMDTQKSGFSNIHIEDGKYAVYSKVRGKQRRYGSFDDIKLALEAREKMYRELRQEVLAIK